MATNIRLSALTITLPVFASASVLAPSHLAIAIRGWRLVNSNRKHGKIGISEIAGDHQAVSEKRCGL
jgi:hypothetical protein